MVKSAVRRRIVTVKMSFIYSSTILRAAIEEGEASGYVEDFDLESHLEELKAKRTDLSVSRFFIKDYKRPSRPGIGAKNSWRYTRKLFDL